MTAVALVLLGVVALGVLLFILAAADDAATPPVISNIGTLNADEAADLDEFLAAARQHAAWTEFYAAEQPQPEGQRP